MLRSNRVAVSFTPASVLVVDDEPAVLRVIVRILEQAGHKVFPCRGMDDVQTHLANGLKPSLLITDVVLGTSTGKRVAAAVSKASPGTRVVFVSGYGNVAVPGQLVLQKPFSRQELVDLVDQVLSAESADSVREQESAFLSSRKKRH